MTALWPIYIASRRRAQTIRLPKALPADANLTVVVEPAEEVTYRAAGHENLLVLNKDDGGLAYVRQAIKDHADAAGLGWFWMLDDDISEYYTVRLGKLHRTPAQEVLEEAQLLIGRPDCAHGALEYKQFAWAATNLVKYGSYCDVAVAINARQTRLCNFRQQLNMKVDRDFTMQVIATGAQVIRCCRLAFGAPKNGSNAGGLSDDYAVLNAERDEVDLMCALWPGVVEKQVKRSGRVDCKIHWELLRLPAKLDDDGQPTNILRMVK